MPWVDASRCKGCNVCIKVCPVPGAIIPDEGAVRIVQDKCTRCGKCMEACPAGAIRPNSEKSSLRGGGFGQGLQDGSGGRGAGRGLGRGGGSGLGGGLGRGGGRGRGRP